MNKFKVAFLCVENACRSQIAEAISKAVAADAYEAFSAGEAIADAINPDAVKVIKERYGIDMTASQKPKTVNDIPTVDIVIRMGCGIQCPEKYNRYAEDWDIEDPSGKGEQAFIDTVEIIESKILDLKTRILNS